MSPQRLADPAAGGARPAPAGVDRHARSSGSPATAGFGTTASLRQHLHAAIGVAPLAYRRTFRGTSPLAGAPPRCDEGLPGVPALGGRVWQSGEYRRRPPLIREAGGLDVGARLRHRGAPATRRPTRMRDAAPPRWPRAWWTNGGHRTLRTTSDPSPTTPAQNDGADRTRRRATRPAAAPRRTPAATTAPPPAAPPLPAARDADGARRRRRPRPRHRPRPSQQPRSPAPRDRAGRPRRPGR